MVKKNDSVFAKAVKELLRLGIALVPVTPKEKSCKLTNWPALATTDREKIMGWYKANPNFNTAAVATPEGYCFLDLDTVDAIKQIEKETGYVFPITYMVKTSKGYHVYFKQTDASRACGNQKKAGLFDFQQSNKYVVGPYSVHPSGIIYEPVDPEVPIIEIPDWLVNWILGQVGSGFEPIEVSEEGEAIVSDEVKEAFEKYLGPQCHNELFTEVGFDPIGNRYAYSRDEGCPRRDKHQNPDSCALNKEFYIYISPTGPQCKCFHTSCGMSQWSDYREFLIEKSGQNFPIYEPSGPIVIGVYDTHAAKLAADIAACEFIPSFPEVALEGSYIGEISQMVTKGTIIPPVFAYTNIKAILGSILDGFCGFPHHVGLHLRHYGLNVSITPQSGKGESRRFIYGFNDNTKIGGVLRQLAIEHGLALEDGNGFGSSAALVDTLSEFSHRRVVLSMDEMKGLFEGKRENSMVTPLLSLYESTTVQHITKTGGTHKADDVRLTISGDFTAEGFREAFGSQQIGDGFLSRCTFGYADKQNVCSDWETWSVAEMTHVVEIVAHVIAAIKNGQAEQGIFTPKEDPVANHLRNDFLKQLPQDKENREFIARVDSQFRQDLLLRCIFSNDGNQMITPEQVERSIAWANYQIAVRKKLWQVESNDPVCDMNRKIRLVVQKHKDKADGISEADLCTLCNVYRDGTQEYLLRAIRALLGTGEISCIGRNKKGRKMYKWNEA